MEKNIPCITVGVSFDIGTFSGGSPSFTDTGFFGEVTEWGFDKLKTEYVCSMMDNIVVGTDVVLSARRLVGSQLLYTLKGEGFDPSEVGMTVLYPGGGSAIIEKYIDADSVIVDTRYDIPPTSLNLSNFTDNLVSSPLALAATVDTDPANIVNTKVYDDTTGIMTITNSKLFVFDAFAADTSIYCVGVSPDSGTGATMYALGNLNNDFLTGEQMCIQVILTRELYCKEYLVPDSGVRNLVSGYSVKFNMEQAMFGDKYYSTIDTDGTMLLPEVGATLLERYNPTNAKRAIHAVSTDKVRDIIPGKLTSIGDFKQVLEGTSINDYYDGVPANGFKVSAIVIGSSNETYCFYRLTDVSDPASTVAYMARIPAEDETYPVDIFEIIPGSTISQVVITSLNTLYFTKSNKLHAYRHNGIQASGFTPIVTQDVLDARIVNGVYGSDKTNNIWLAVDGFTVVYGIDNLFQLGSVLDEKAYIDLASGTILGISPHPTNNSCIVYTADGMIYRLSYNSTTTELDVTSFYFGSLITAGGGIQWVSDNYFIIAANTKLHLYSIADKIQFLSSSIHIGADDTVDVANQYFWDEERYIGPDDYINITGFNRIWDNAIFLGIYNGIIEVQDDLMYLVGFPGYISGSSYYRDGIIVSEKYIEITPPTFENRVVTSHLYNTSIDSDELTNTSVSTTTNLDSVDIGLYSREELELSTICISVVDGSYTEAVLTVLNTADIMAHIKFDTLKDSNGKILSQFKFYTKWGRRLNSLENIPLEAWSEGGNWDDSLFF